MGFLDHTEAGLVFGLYYVLLIQTWLTLMVTVY